MYFSWKEYLLRQARLSSMCTENLDALKSCETKEEAISLYKKTVDWALERDFPPLIILRKEFGNFEKLGLFVDHDFNGELLNEHQCYIFHNCRGHIKVDLNLSEKIIPMLYFANGCDMMITRFESHGPFSIKVPLYIYGDNNIVADNNEDIIFSRKGGAR